MISCEALLESIIFGKSMTENIRIKSLESEHVIYCCFIVLFCLFSKLLLYFSIKVSVDIKVQILCQGGGWCNNVRTCVYRKKTRRGSSTFMEKEIPFTGILSNKPEDNPGSHSIELPRLLNLCFSVYLPIDLAVWLMLFNMIVDFFNWNRVKIRYCDGASFAGDSEHKVNFDSWSP